MKKFIIVLWIITISLLVYIASHIRYYDPSPELQPIAFKFEADGFEKMKSDFWDWDGGQYAYFYLKKHEPIAYFHSGIFSVAYNSRNHPKHTSKPMVYVYDMWRGSKHDEKVKSVYVFREDVMNWAEMASMDAKSDCIPSLIDAKDIPQSITENITKQIIERTSQLSRQLNRR